MKTLTFGFSRPTVLTLFARLIMFADGTAYDHVYIKWPWGAISRDVIYQASKLAVNFESNVTFDGHAITLEEYSVDVADALFDQIMQVCMDNSNKPYSIMGVVGFAYVKIVKFLFRAKVHNPFPTHGESFVCSKLMALVASMIPGMDITSSFDDIDPLDFKVILDKAVQAGVIRKLT